MKNTIDLAKEAGALSGNVCRLSTLAIYGHNNIHKFRIAIEKEFILNLPTPELRKEINTHYLLQRINHNDKLMK
jgi:hypothetical protein